MNTPCMENPNGWFPPDGTVKSEEAWYDSDEANEARAACFQDCPLGARECLEKFGKIKHGIVGGTTPREREVMEWRQNET